MRLSNLYLSLASLFLLIAGVNAQAKLKVVGQMLLYTCNDVVSLFNFDSDIVSYYGKICGYEPMLGTVLHCVYDYSQDILHRNPEKSLKEAFGPLKQYCYPYGGIFVDDAILQAAFDNATDYMVNYTSLANATELVSFPLHVDMAAVDNEYNAYLGFYDNYDMSNIYGGIILAYWGLVLFISAIFNFLTKTRLIQKFNNTFINQFRRYITLPSLFNTQNTRHVKGYVFFTSLIATRLEAIIIFFYLVVHIVVLSVRYYWDVHNVVFINKEAQVTRWLADRTGIIAFAHIPLIVLFGGRNNMFQWLTGFNYASFIQFHKWTGRVMFIDALIHSVAYTRNCIIYSDLASSFEDVYFQMGVVATIFCGIMVFQSLLFLRNNKYEIFLFIHIVLALLFIWTCWEHCLSLGWMEWLYASIAIWCFDRFLRLVRMVSFGCPKANVSLVGEDTIRIVVPSNGGLISHHAKPGQYVFVYFLKPTMFWQSHPFTVMDSVHNDKEFTLFIKTKRGLTGRLAKYLQQQDGKSVSNLRVTLEGPYGDSSPCGKYDNALLLAGGNGIPGILDHALKLSKMDKQTKVNLHWVTHTLDSMTWLKPELELLQNTNVGVNVYLTRELPTGPEDSSLELTSSHELKKDEVTETLEKKTDSEDETCDLSVKSLKKFVKFHYRRPDLKSLIETSLQENGKGSTAIVTCGPDSFCGAIRKITAESLVGAAGRVDLFEELQMW